MRMMGEQFVTGQTIAEALANSRRLERQGFRLLLRHAGRGRADRERRRHPLPPPTTSRRSTPSDAPRPGRGVYEGPGISIKLSALHPRYGRAQRERVTDELLPRLVALAALARRYDIGLNIDAEEADRLELSLDLLEAICLSTRARRLERHRLRGPGLSEALRRS